MRLPTPGFLFTALFQAFQRFPGAMLCATVGVYACVILISDRSYDPDRAYIWERVWMICQLGLPLLTALVAFAESKDWTGARTWLLQAVGLLAVAACWGWLNPKAPRFEAHILPQYLVLLLVAHLAVAVAPYLNQRSVREFWEYNRQLFANLVVGGAFTLILYAGLALALLAVDNLFDLHFEERIYANLFVLLVGIFNTAYFLYHFPVLEITARETATENRAYNWVFRSLCKFILIPIVLLYFVILYAYGAKIGLEWSLPRGWVSSLVIGFSVAGIFTYLLNFYLPEEDKSWIVTGFKRWFWWVVLPLTLLLFIAIGKRIGDYGVTEERFLVAQLGVWLALICAYFLFSKTDNIKFIPISLALFALSWAFGPLSAFSVSERSQKGIVSDILTRNGRMENGIMKPGSIPLSAADGEQARSAIIYLRDRDALQELLPTPLDSNLLEYGNLLFWLNIDSSKEVGMEQTLSLSYNNQRFEKIDIRGFDLLFPVELSDISRDFPVMDGHFFRLSENRMSLEWHEIKNEKNTLIAVFDLSPTLQQFRKKMNAGESYTYTQMNADERLVNFSHSRGAIRLVINEVQLQTQNDELDLTHIFGWILLKVK